MKGLLSWMWRSMCSLKALSETMYLPHQSQLKCVFKGIASLNKCEITLVAFVWPFLGVCFQMSPQIAYTNPRWLHLVFQMCPQWATPHCENIVTSKGLGRRSWRTLKSLFTLYKQIPKNPRILYVKIPGFWPGNPIYHPQTYRVLRSIAIINVSQNRFWWYPIFNWEWFLDVWNWLHLKI